MTMGEKIKDRREALQMTQEDLGVEVGVGRSFICKIETDVKHPNVLLLARIAKALRCTMDELVEVA